MEGFDNEGRHSVDRARLKTVKILGNEIPSKVFKYGVNCHQIKLRLNSALIFAVTATSEGLFAPLEGCLCQLGAIIIELHSFLAQYFEPPIVYFFSFPVEIPIWQCLTNRKANNDVFSILWHQLRVLFQLLGVGSRVRWLHSWDNLRIIQFAPRYTRCEQYMWYVMPKQHPAWRTVVTASTKSRREAPHSWGAWWLWKMKAGPFCVH